MLKKLNGATVLQAMKTEVPERRREVIPATGYEQRRTISCQGQILLS
jgi:hypothetical protein